MEKIVLTPGEMVRNVKPWSAKDWAYCTVNMFRAALETLYAGTGKIAYLGAMPIEPRVVELMFIIRPVL